MTGKGNNFVVASLVGKRTDYDWCGSIGQAMKRRAELIATGNYGCVFLQRVRLTKGRKRGTKRWLYATDPAMIWRAAAAERLAIAA